MLGFPGDYRLNLPYGVDGPYYLASADGRRSAGFTLHTWKPTLSATGTKVPDEGLDASFQLPAWWGGASARGRSVAAGAAPVGMFLGPPYGPELQEGFFACVLRGHRQHYWLVSHWLSG